MRKIKAVDIRVIGRRADCRNIEILVPVFDLETRTDLRDNRGHMLHAPGEGHGVVGRQGPLISCYATAKPGRRLDRVNIPAQCGHLLVNLALGTCAQCNHSDHRSDAYDYTEHGQQRPKQITVD